MTVRLVGTRELTLLWGVSRQRVDAIVDAADFPRGEHLTTGRVYAWDEVVAWSLRVGRRMYPVPGYPDPNPPHPTEV